MLESLKIILGETFEIYNLATLGGRMFIPFFICLIWLLFTSKPEDDRARRYIVYPALVMMFFLFNPVFIHLLYKYVGVPERIVRMFWPLPMDMIVIYCLIRLLSGLNRTWKKAALIACTAFLLFLNANGSRPSESYSRALNTDKMPIGSKEVCDSLFILNDFQLVDAIIPTDLFFWSREYNPAIRIPYARDMDEMVTENGELDIDLVGKAAIEGNCGFVVLNASEPSVGDITDYGFEYVKSVNGRDCQYLIYKKAN